MRYMERCSSVWESAGRVVLEVVGSSPTNVSFAGVDVIGNLNSTLHPAGN